MAQSRSVACGWLVTLLLASSMVAAQAPATAPTPPPPAGPINAAEIDALLKQFNVPGVSIAVIRTSKSNGPGAMDALTPRLVRR